MPGASAAWRGRFPATEPRRASGKKTAYHSERRPDHNGRECGTKQDVKETLAHEVDEESGPQKVGERRTLGDHLERRES